MLLALTGAIGAQAQQEVQLLDPAKHPSRATVERVKADRTARQAGVSRNVWVFDTARVFPHLAVGQEWETSFVIVNMSTDPARFNLGFFDTTGAPMTVSYSDGKSAPAASGAVVTQTLAAEGSTVITVYNDGRPLRTGFAILEPPSETQRLGGYAVFKQRVAGRPDFEAVVPLTDYDDWAVYLPFDNSPGLDTGMALVNPSKDQTATVDLYFIDEAGARITKQTLTLKPGEQTAFSLTEKYPALKGKRGTLYAESSIDYLSVLGLRFNLGGGGAFTSLPAMNWKGMFPE
ncbi:MAG: hypothetical protein C0504_11815 [Candidatus Solibacter sp.]|nr:hypothetical protein [Candidatus Solibacter sp.]